MELTCPVTFPRGVVCFCSAVKTIDRVVACRESGESSSTPERRDVKIVTSSYSCAHVILSQANDSGKLMGPPTSVRVMENPSLADLRPLAKPLRSRSKAFSMSGLGASRSPDKMAVEAASRASPSSLARSSK